VIKKTLLDTKTLQKANKHPVSAKAVIIFGGKVLLLKQPNGRWDLPGGKVDSGEDIVEGLIREVEEETGLKVWPMKALLTKTKKFKKNKDILVITFLCSTLEPVKKKHVQLSKEHKKFTFIEILEALELNMRKRHKKAIKAAQEYLAGLAAPLAEK